MSQFTTQATLLNAVTADTTGEGVFVGDRVDLSFQFIATGISAGNGVFTVDVSNDGVNWVAYNRLTDNLTNTNTQADTRVASVTLNSNTNKIYFKSHGDHFAYVRAVVDRTTDGAYTCLMHAVE